MLCAFDPSALGCCQTLEAFLKFCFDELRLCTTRSDTIARTTSTSTVPVSLVVLLQY